MRIRSVRPDFWSDREGPGRWPPEMKLVYIGLWCVADDEGRFEFEPALLRAQLDPFDTIPGLMDVVGKLAATGRVALYEVEGRVYGDIPDFREHQRPQKPVKSRLPEATVGLPYHYSSPTVALSSVEESRGEERSSHRREKKPRADAPDPRAREVRARWCSLWSQHRPEIYVGKPVKDNTHVAALLKARPDLTLEQIEPKMLAALKSPGWVGKLNLSSFCTNYDLFISSASLGPQRRMFKDFAEDGSPIYEDDAA